LQASALVDDQVRVVESPSVIEAGCAEKVAVGGTSFTVITRGAEVTGFPGAQVILRVYVPAFGGYSTAEP